MPKFLISAVTLGVMAVTSIAGGAHAALVSTGTPCEVTSVVGATACAGVFEGNDSNQDLDGLFGFNGWTEVLKLGGSSGTASNDGITLTVTNSGSGGTWTINGYGGYEPVMFVTKGGPTFSAFLMDFETLTGAWNTNSMLTGGKKPKPGAGLSHWTIYEAGLAPINPNPGPAPVPLPAAAWMLIAGIGALAGVRRARG